MISYLKNLFSTASTWLKTYTDQPILVRVGFYGLLCMLFIYYASEWMFTYSVNQRFMPNIPPSWYELGSINHFLGTDNQGYDIFYRLLASYKMTLLITLRTTLYMVLAGVLINYLIYKFKTLRMILTLILRVFMLIPPLLTVMVVAILFDHRFTFILLTIGLAYLPSYVNNIQQSLDDEWNKSYVLADQLDGISKPTLFFRMMLPNLLPNYVIQVIRLFSQILLATVIITFLKFGAANRIPDLGEMMRDMLAIYTANPWGVISAGFSILITIFFINLITLGIQRA